MSIILGYEPDKTSATISPELKARGINRIRCTLSEMRAWSVPTLYQTAFRSYIGLLPAFMRACQTRVNVDVREPGQPVSIKFADSFQLPYPDMSIITNGESQADKDTLLELGGELQLIRKSTVFKFKNPTKDVIAKIVKMKVNKTCQASDHTVNMAAFDTFKLTARIFSEFLRVHRYPAYEDTNHYWSHLPDRSFEVENKEETIGKRKRNESDVTNEEKERQAKQQRGGSKKVVIHVDKGVQPAKPHGHDSIERIKTLPEPAQLPWASRIDDLPPTYGIWIPYISQLYFFDTVIVPNVVAKYFASSLGSSKEACLRGLESMRADWGVLGKTESGKQMSHMAFCIDLALQSQARPVPLFLDGRYCGIFISGYGWTMMVNGVEYNPKPFNEVLSAIEETTNHVKVLGQILEKLDVSGDMAAEMGERWTIAKDPNTTMMTLRTLALGARVSLKDKSDILELALALDFRRPHWGTNASTIATALSLISDVGQALPQDLPIHPSMLFVPDRLDVVWSCFGFSAPTFRPASGQLVKLSDKTYDITTKRGQETKVETLRFEKFHVSHAELQTAIADMKAVRDTGKVGILRQMRREAKYSMREFSGVDFTRIKEGLDKLAGMESKGKEKAVVTVENHDSDIEVDDEDL